MTPQWSLCVSTDLVLCRLFANRDAQFDHAMREMEIEMAKLQEILED